MIGRFTKALATDEKRSVVSFKSAASRSGSLPKNFGIRRLIWIESLRLRVCRNEHDINATIVSQPGRMGIAHPLVRRLVRILCLQVANCGLVQRFLLAIPCGVNLLRCDSL